MPGFFVASIAGLALLTVASDHFVLGASRLALTWRVRPVLVGAVIIGFGTSAPELVVSSIAAAQGSIDIAVTNVAGSNLANITLILGVAALMAPFTVADGVMRREAPLATGSVVLFALALLGGVQRYEGAVLFAGLVAALTWIIRHEVSSRTAEAEVAEFADVAHPHPVWQESLRTVAGLAGTMIGAQLLVYGARGIAEAAGLSEGFIGLTLVALGTSLPELATAIQAARRRETELIVGNVLGSNIFNSFGVAGVAAMVGPGASAEPGLWLRATVVMLVGAFLAHAFLQASTRLGRAHGAILLAVYATAIAVTAL